jgi:hypothetical protein
LLSVRIERTRMPAADKAANTPLRSWLRGIASVSVWSFGASSVMFGSTGSVAGKVPSMSNTKPSMSSIASSDFIGPDWMIWPWSMIARLRHRLSASSR